ncbi:MAG TPA: hypothetical protein VNN24_06790 [Candidatus Binatus sp.]|nr:hypothetical protein [Candidatus Binatus sp.]
MFAASLGALLTRSIDYAGMFPPCSLALEPALQNQARYVRDPDAWMLNNFVLPVEKFDAAVAGISLFDRKHPLRISALGGKSANEDEFLAALKIAADKIRSFSADHVDLVSIPQLEMPLPQNVDLESLVRIGSILKGLELQAFWETPVDSAEKTIALFAEHNSSVDGCPFGYKLRTGGVTADAFPTSPQIARALVAAAKARVPIKFTAGLHHPIRQFRDEVNTKMHGFLNVLGAAVLGAEHEWDEQQTSEMLEDENAASFLFSDDSFAWRAWKIATDQIEARRKFVTSFGSCSFDEPREDLRALKLLTN